MADIAEIGFRANTSDLDTAVVKLNLIKPAAEGVTVASAKVAAAVEGASQAIVSAAVIAAKAEQMKAAAILKTLLASESAAEADIVAATATKVQADATFASAKAEQARTNSLLATAGALREVTAATAAATAATRSFQSLALPASVTRNAFNLASGRNDSPVPAGGGGQNPPANNNNAPNRFMTGNIAAQFHDIGVTAAMGMNPMTIALQQGTQLIQVLKNMESPLAGLREAFAHLFDAFSLGVIAAVALVAALIELVNWTKLAKSGLYELANGIKAVGPYAIALAGLLALIYGPAIITGIAMVTARIIGMGVGALIAGAQMAAAWLLGLGPLGWILIGMASIVTGLEVLSKKFHSTFATEMLKTIKEGANKAIAIFDGLSAAWDAIWKKGGKSITQTFTDAYEASSRIDHIGNAVKEVGNASDKAASAVKKFADGIGVSESALKKRQKAMLDVITSGQKDIQTEQAKAAAMGKTAYQVAYLTEQTKLYNDALEKHLVLTPKEKAELDLLAAKYAGLKVQVDRNTKATDFAKDATKGFFSDMKTGLQAGESMWKSFGNAVSNVLNKIADKLLDSGIDAMFSGGAGSGIGSMLTSASKFLFNAKGNVYANDNVQQFANGAGFTNGIVSSPTLFKFAKGAGLGEMGEAGPEAIMPLSRGPDGSLGVKAHGGGGGVGVVVNIYENNSGATATVNQRQTSNGTEIDVVLDSTVASKIGSKGSNIEKALDARASRKLIRRG